MNGHSTDYRSEAGRAGHRRGLWAERLAAAYMWMQGYAIVEHRYRGPSGEIDLVCRRGKRLVFVEVKVRQSVADSLEAVTPAAQARIIRAAEAFIAENPNLADCTWRFDVIALAGWRWPVHVKAAFHAPG